ncbi:MAG: GEVED domain-containing protein [Candidatus Kapaibacteriota bacterium]
MKRLLRLIGYTIVSLLVLADTGSNVKAQTYCIPLTSYGCAGFGDFIAGFAFANLSNLNSGCTSLNGNSYSYFNALAPAQVMAGQTYSFTHVNNPSYAHNVAIWIDYNQNGTFESTERVWGTTSPVPTNFTTNGTITIPTTALPGVTRLRIRSQDGPVINDPCASFTYTEAEDYNVSILSGSVTNAWPGGANFPGITANSVVLEVGQTFDGSSAAFPKPSVRIERLNVTNFSQRFTYEIQALNVAGVTAGTVMYEMRDPANPTSKTIPVAPGTTQITYAAEAASGIMASGSNGTFTTVGAIGGTYKVVIKHELLNSGNVISTQNLEYPFNIAVNRDISVSSIESPLPSRRQAYIGSVPIRVRFMNVGLRAVTRYKAYYEIRNSITQALIKSDSVERSTDQGGGLPTGGIVTSAIDEVLFPSTFAPATPDSFCIVAKARLLETDDSQFAVDQQTGNDRFPATDCGYKFRMWYLTDFEARSLINPSSGTVYYTGRPIKPIAVIANNGLNVDEIPVQMTARLNGNIIAQSTVNVEVPSGSYNIFPAYFEEFTPSTTGNLEICIETFASGDQYAPNNKSCYTFTINERLNGTYTIGTVPKPGVQNFTTLKAAVDALYARGVSGPVKFLFTDAFYSISGSNPNEPALDLTSNIIGVGPTSPVSFSPDPTSVGLLRAGVTIQLNSPNGVGIQFGQSSSPWNPNAVFREFSTKANANYPGYITFDGGSQKSLRLRLKTPANRRAVVYFGNRTYNTTIKNCLIEMDPSTPETEFWSTIPRVAIDQSNLLFLRDSNATVFPAQFFSAGIVQRNLPPADQFGQNRLGLDTVLVENNITYRGNKENKIQNNEITGFGIGVLSVGIGVLKERNKLVRYYNSGTEISGNIISKVGRTGVFIGYEDGAKISRNKIYNVAGTFNALSSAAATAPSTYVFDEVSGIEAGLWTDTTSTSLGYNNINTEISYNEINDVRGYFHSRGILVNQSQNNFSQTGILENVLQPNVPERTKIFGNVIFDLRRGVVTAAGTIFRNSVMHRTGIQLTTDRNSGWTSTLDATNLNSLLNPRFAFNSTKDARRYFTREDFIANNTVLIQDDSLSTLASFVRGAAMGISVINAVNTRMMNNAVAVTAPLHTASITAGYPNTAFFHIGLLPAYNGGLRSNFNAVWPAASPSPGVWQQQGSFMRFVEIDTLSQILLASCRDEYQTRDQWYNWTGQDNQSFVGNFFNSTTDQLLRIGNEPVVRLRQASRIGSMLNNAGTNLTEVPNDIDGDTRGSAGNRYDIGADEYDAIPYLNDVEVMAIVAPRAYRSGTCSYPGGVFSDVEYITADTSSVPVMVRVRNNSTLSQTINLTGSIAMEDAATSGNPTPTYGIPSTINTVSVTISGGETRDVMLGRVNLQTLRQLGTGYTTPSWMSQAVESTMRPNVTPRYLFRAFVATFNSDENRFNDTTQAESRFYIRQASATKFLVSAEFTGYPHTTTPPSTTGFVPSAIARLNSDSLRVALDTLGFFSDPLNNPNNRPFRYDIFDRSGWEAKTFDYTPYKMLLWSNDNAGLLRTERDQIRKYLASGTQQTKKNLIIASEAIVGNHIGLNATNDQFFVREQLRANVSTTNAGAVQSTPFASGYTPSVVTNGQSFIDGVFVQRGIPELVRATGFVNTTWTDPNPRPSMMKIYTDMNSKGFARQAFRYRSIDAAVAVKDSTMGITTTSPTTNVIFYGMDWRHVAKNGPRTGLERLLRASFDHVQFNEGRVTPVELVAFDARRTGSAVALDWATASEQNSGWYEVERAVATGNELAFERIETIPAAGNSTTRREYNAVDNNVRNGATYVYRLRMVDRDGTFEYSDEVAVVIGDNSNNAVSISEARPNPVSGVANFEYTINTTGSVRVELTDMIGRVVSTIFEGNVSAGTHGLEVSAESLAAGMYQIVIKSGDNVATRSLQVVK